MEWRIFCRFDAPILAILQRKRQKRQLPESLQNIFEAENEEDCRKPGRSDLMTFGPWNFRHSSGQVRDWWMISTSCFSLILGKLFSLANLDLEKLRIHNIKYTPWFFFLFRHHLTRFVCVIVWSTSSTFLGWNLRGCPGLCEVSDGEPAEVTEFFPRCESTDCGSTANSFKIVKLFWQVCPWIYFFKQYKTCIRRWIWKSETENPCWYVAAGPEALLDEQQ